MKLKKKLFKGEQEASAADDSREAKAPVEHGVADTDYEEATEGTDEELEDAAKSEDPASDSDHISHPRTEEGEEEQRGGGMEKAEDEGSEEDEEEDESEQQNKNPMFGKSLTRGDLLKSLDRLAAYAEKNSTEGRKLSLLNKAARGELSKSEKSELFDVLGGKREQAPSLAKSATRGLSSNPAVRKALDVSEFLTEQHSELTKSLSYLGQHIEKSDKRQHDFNLILAKAVADMGNLVKSLAEQVGAVSSQPARAPKSRGVAGIMEKSFGGSQSASSETLSKSEVLDALDAIHNDAMAKSGSGIVDGEDVSIAISKYESFNQISPKMLNAIRNHTRARIA